MYTPAETIAAAWIMALTGVGPSIASGSQTCSGNWALLPIVPITRKMPISPAALRPLKMMAGLSARLASSASLKKISRKLSVPVSANR